MKQENNGQLPNCFIVGAARSGTTSLWSYLGQHPEIGTANDILHKEPAYFCNIKGTESWENYISLFDLSEQFKIICEASTAYLTCPKTAERISNYVKNHDINPKIIIMLRNPIYRAYSLYNWMTREGYEWAPTFEIALSLEERRAKRGLISFLEPEYYYNYLYFRSGLYYHQVKPYLANFSSEDVKIILFEDFANNTLTVVQDTFKFLEVEASYEPSLKVHNKSRRVVFPPLQWFLKKVNILFRKLPFVAFETKKARNRLLQFGILASSKKSMKAKTKLRLLKGYKDDIKKLASLINRDLSHWLSEDV